jgi:hypothetical protein
MSATIASGPPGNKPKLLQPVRDVIRRKQYSIRTEQVCVDWIRRFILHHNKRHPSGMAEESITLNPLGSINTLDRVPHRSRSTLRNFV